MGQRSSSDEQLISKTDMKVQMTFFIMGAKWLYPLWGGCLSSYRFRKVKISSANSSRIKSYDRLKLTLFFQSGNDFMDFIQDQKRVRDQIFKMAQTHAQDQL